MMKFKAAMFDYDGTITEKGVNEPSDEMLDYLVKLAKKMPIGLCTGRQRMFYETPTFTALADRISAKERDKFLERLFLVVENGGTGLFFDKKTHSFKPYYDGNWPDKILNKEKFQDFIDAQIKGLGATRRVHKIVSVIDPTYKDNPSPDEIYRRSGKILIAVKELLKATLPSFEKYFHLLNSGIGVLIVPAKFDKDYGVKKFVEFLKKKYKIKLSKNLKEILLVGDSGQKNGNDYYFLRGKFGTPYTVDSRQKNAKFPKQVTDQKGKKILNSKGTIYLLKTLGV